MTPKLIPGLLKKALALVEANPAHAWTVGEMASACGVGQRTLQRQFRCFFDRTPMAYVRDFRLDRARRELLCPSGPVKVTEIAGRCGFNHFGRFAALYRRRFGEAPSATLRRQQNVLGRSARPLPPLPIAVDRPRIAVLPFEPVRSGSHLAAAFADQIVAALIHLRSMDVGVAASSRYHLRGKVQDDGAGHLRVTTILVDAVAGRCRWADYWDGDSNDLFGFEERIAARVATAIQLPIWEAEIDRAWREDAARLSAWHLTMRALPRVLSIEPAAEEMALELLEQAMEAAPQDALPVALAAWCHGLRGSHNFCARPDREKAVARALAEHAARLNNSDALTEAFLAAGFTLAHDLSTAAVHADRAVAFDGGSAWAWARVGWLRAYNGEWAEAIETFQISRALAPTDRMGFLSCVGMAVGHFGAGRYDEAAYWFERGLAQNPAATWINHALTPAYALGGRKEQARRSLAELTRAFPDLTIAQVRSGLPYHPSYLDRVADGLESAGMR
ncbi:AraC-like DNA-binding protein [Bradyrhizobium sp. USDA 4354]